MMLIFLCVDAEFHLWWCWFSSVVMLSSICDGADFPLWWCWVPSVMVLIFLCDAADFPPWCCWFLCVLMLISLCADIDFPLCWCWFLSVLMLIFLISCSQPSAENPLDCYGLICVWSVKEPASPQKWVICNPSTADLTSACHPFIRKSLKFIWLKKGGGGGGGFWFLFTVVVESYCFHPCVVSEALSFISCVQFVAVCFSRPSRSCALNCFCFFYSWLPVVCDVDCGVCLWFVGCTVGCGCGLCCVLWGVAVVCVVYYGVWLWFVLCTMGCGCGLCWVLWGVAVVCVVYYMVWALTHMMLCRVLTCLSQPTCACFSPSRASLVIAGMVSDGTLPTPAYSQTHTRTHTHTQAHVSRLFTNTCTHTHTHTHTQTQAWTNNHTQLHLDSHTHTHIYTHMHTVNVSTYVAK